MIRANVTTALLAGRVLDNNDVPQSGVLVVLRREHEPTALAQYVTGPDGSWEFSIYASGSYDVIAPDPESKLEFVVTVPGGDLIM